MARNLTENSITRHIVDMTIPMIFGMFSMMAYNLADTWFIGQLGDDQLSAISFTFPVVMIIGSISMGIGTGTSSVLSRSIGRGDRSAVQKYTTDSLILSILVVAVFSIVGFFTITPLFMLLGAPEELIPYIHDYMEIWYIGVLFLIIPMVGNGAIRATGNTRFPATIMTVAAILNFALDPLLIFGLGPFPSLGIKGAALSSLISRAIILVGAMYFMGVKEKLLIKGFPTAKRLLHSWKEILYISLPSVGTNLLSPVTHAVIYNLISQYGKSAVAGIGVSTRIEAFGMIILISMTSALMPIVGQNFGANKNKRILTAIKAASLFSLAWSTVLITLYFFFSDNIGTLFTTHESIIGTISLYLMTVSWSYGFQGIFMVSVSSLNAMRKPIHASLLHIIRLFVLYIPLAVVLNNAMGIQGIFIGLVMANIISGILALVIAVRSIRGRDVEEKPEIEPVLPDGLF